MKICRQVITEDNRAEREDTGLHRVVFDFEDGRRIRAWLNTHTGRLVLNGAHDMGTGTLAVVPRGGNSIEVEVIG